MGYTLPEQPKVVLGLRLQFSRICHNGSGNYNLEAMYCSFKCLDVFLHVPNTVNVEKLQSVMMEVMRYCSKQTQHNQSMPLPGSACCAQFSGHLY